MLMQMYIRYRKFQKLRLEAKYLEFFKSIQDILDNFAKYHRQRLHQQPSRHRPPKEELQLLKEQPQNQELRKPREEQQLEELVKYS